MSPTTATLTDQSKTIRRWNSILNSDHKRSQSLNSMNKSPATDAARSTISLGTLKSRDDEQSSIHTSSTTEVIPEEEDDQQESTSPARSVNSRQSFNTSPPPRPRPAPRLWDEPKSATPSLQGLETAIAPGNNSQDPGQTTSPLLSTSPVPTASPRALVSKFSTWKEKSFAGRRKGSVPDLELGIKKPFNPDSPSLPPIQSARTPNTIVTMGSITPKHLMNDSVLADTNPYASLRTPEWHERDQKRASSMLLPSNLAPIVIPLMPTRTAPLPPPINTTMAVCMEQERPPRPPPKSPRTLLRAFPVPKSAATGKHTASSSINSISPVETPSTAATPWSPTPAQSISPMPIASTFSKSPSRGPAASSYDEAKLTIASQFQSPVRTPKHERSVSSPHTEQKFSSSPTQPSPNHKRMVSETSSVMNRGRPTKRNSKRATMRGPKMVVATSQFEALPQGINKSQTSQVPMDELHRMRRDAEEVASEQYILTQKQIAALNQEQRSLDENCAQLQRVISGLKEARKATYLSLKLYLDAPDTTTDMRDYVTKQTKNLSSLDAQIDEKQDRLDVVGDRKLAIQSKVWEHMAAVLAIVNANGELGRTEEHTPPRSPERGMRFANDVISEDIMMYDTASTTRGDVESITIYADSGVASLLRSIEEELDVIDQSRYRDEEDMMMM